MPAPGVERENAFPTEARLRAKAKEKAGYKAKKRPKVVENHHDDLGDDLAGLGPNIEELMADIVPEHIPPEDPVEVERKREASA